MAIPLTGSGGLFVALGHLFGGLADLVSLRGGQSTARVTSSASFKTRRNTVSADYAAQTPNHTYLLGTLDAEYSAWSKALNTFFKAQVAEAQSLLIEMANDDTKLPSKTLFNALVLLFTQMTNSSDSVQQSTVSAGAQTAYPGVTNIGNGKVIMSVVNGYGKTLQYPFPEKLTFTCTNDSYQGSATINQEQFSCAGQTTVTDTYNFQNDPWGELWPLGSGVSVNLNTCDPSQQNSGTQLQALFNGNFANWSNSNYPDDYVIELGTAGTQVFQDAAHPFISGGLDLQLTGDVGGTLTSVTQQFNKAHSTAQGAGGTPYVPAPDVPFAVSLWTRVSATPAAGVLTISLVDQNGTAISDDSSTSNSFTIALTGETTSYAFHSAVFRLPASQSLVSPNTVRLRIKLTTAIDNGKSVNISNVGFTPMVQFYTGGPYIAIMSGSTPWAQRDSFTSTISNDLGGTAPQWNNYFLRAFSVPTVMRARPDLQLPFSGAPTVAASLIT